MTTTKKKRIEELERRVAELEARLWRLEYRPIYEPPGYPFYSPIVTCADKTVQVPDTFMGSTC